MSIPEFEVHRAVVQSANAATGKVTVKIPAILGSAVVAVPSTGLAVSGGVWTVPDIGAKPFIAVSTDRTQVFWLTDSSFNGGDFATSAQGALADTAVQPGDLPTLGTAASEDVGYFAAAAQAVPVGSIITFAGATPPAGYLVCDGSAVSRTTYAGLFAVVGTTHGVGDGSTTFGLPNLTNRFIVGQGTTWAATLGATGGSADAVVVAHTHGYAHTHGTAHTHSIGHDHGAFYSWNNTTDHSHTINHDHTVFDSGLTSLQVYQGLGGNTQAGFLTSSTASNGTPSGNNILSHDHPVNVPAYSGSSGGVSSAHDHYIDVPNYTGNTSSQSTETTASQSTSTTGGGTGEVAGTEKNLPPYIIMSYLVKY